MAAVTYTFLPPQPPSPVLLSSLGYIPLQHTALPHTAQSRFQEALPQAPTTALRQHTAHLHLHQPFLAALGFRLQQCSHLLMHPLPLTAPNPMPMGPDHTAPPYPAHTMGSQQQVGGRI